MYKATHQSALKMNQSIHSGVMFGCDQCEYRFTEKTSLMRHIHRVQTFLGDPKKSPIGDFRRPYFFKKETKSGLKKETW